MTSPNAADVAHRDVPLTLIALDAENARKTYDQGALESLAASLKAVGMIQPIVLRRVASAATGSMPRQEYVVVAGHRRFKAAKLAGLTVVPAVIRDVTPAQARLAQFAENHEREGLTPLEEAQHLARHLVVTKQTQEQLATALGVAPSVISDAVTLANLPPSAQKLFTGKDPLSAAHARELARLKAYPEALEERVKNLEHDRKYNQLPTSKQLRQNVDWDLQDIAARDKVEKQKVADAKKAAAEKDKAKADTKAQKRAAAEREKLKRQREAEARAAERYDRLHGEIVKILNERTPRYIDAVLAVRKEIKLPEFLLLTLAGELEFNRSGSSDYCEDLEERILPKLPGILKSGGFKERDPKGSLSFVAACAWICTLEKAFDQELEATAKKRLEAGPAKKGAR